jgi:hydroxylamine reductase (hybrid-cluster protein)
MADPVIPTPAKPRRTTGTPGTGKASGKAGGATAPKTGARAKIAAKASDVSGKVTEKVKDAVNNSGIDWNQQGEQIKTQAAKVARAAAGTAKDKTGAAIGGLARLITETAGTVDAKLGPQYGDYARQAAEAVAGAAKSLDSKDVDQLLNEARDFVRKSPAVAIGAAAVAGYVLMRLAKGSGDRDA